MRASWEAFYASVEGCQACRLCQGRTRVVPGEGDPNAQIMFVGEGPGRDEDLQGRPFVGASGQLLTRMIAAIGLEREQVYICNVVKCRPPGNRNPQPDEIAACLGHLRQQFALVRPKVIVLLGGVAASALLGEKVYITRAHGVWHERKGVQMMATFHPSALLRGPENKRAAWEDFQTILPTLREMGL